MWAFESVFYQIYPLGFCGAPFENDGVLTPRIKKVAGWIPHIKKLGANAVYFSPLFESDTHGYNTRDFRTVDRRLGTNEDFAELCRLLHEEGIRIWALSRTSAPKPLLPVSGRGKEPGEFALPELVPH